MRISAISRNDICAARSAKAQRENCASMKVDSFVTCASNIWDSRIEDETRINTGGEDMPNNAFSNEVREKIIKKFDEYFGSGPPFDLLTAEGLYKNMEVLDRAYGYIVSGQLRPTDSPKYTDAYQEAWGVAERGTDADGELAAAVETVLRARHHDLQCKEVYCGNEPPEYTDFAVTELEKLGFPRVSVDAFLYSHFRDIEKMPRYRNNLINKYNGILPDTSAFWELIWG